MAEGSLKVELSKKFEQVVEKSKRKPYDTDKLDTLDIQEALAEVERGEVTSFDSVEDWWKAMTED